MDQRPALGNRQIGQWLSANVPATGQPLDSGTRSFMETRFGRDFSAVRVHTNADAAAAADVMNAVAYTTGGHVVFGSGQYAPTTPRGRQLLAHELAHVVQQADPSRPRTIQRQAPPPPPPPPVVPAFRDCTPRITGVADANDRLEAGRDRARRFMGTARDRLNAAPAAGTVYATALARHFIAPSAADRAAIRGTYAAILANLAAVNNFICNSNMICGAEQAKWRPDDDLIHVCRPFWPLNVMCRAIVLIHEGAHDAGIDIAGAHTANRGSANYPAGNVAPPGAVTTATRMNTPDAYAFFAAHVWRDTDTASTCF